MQSLEIKLDELCSRLSYQRDIKNGGILCFTESWLNDDMDDMQSAGFRQDRTAASGKTRAGCLSIVKNCWCAMSNIKEVLMYCSPEVEYLMISCRPHYIPREFLSLLFVAVSLPRQTDTGTKIALNELYKAISNQENAHPKAALLVVGDFNAVKLKPFYLISTSMSHVQPEGKKYSRPPLLHTQQRIQRSPSSSIWQI